MAYGELNGGTTCDIPINPFEIDVRYRLTAAGMDLATQVGVGSYRLDFAVRHPEHCGRYVMAIEADRANCPLGHVARERDRLRQRLLEARGWKFHHIWSTDWFKQL
jgi:very-short-patch-repair endonuclease